MCRPLLLLLSAWMLTACASGVPPTQGPILTPPEEDMATCPALAQPASGKLTDLLTDHIATAEAYHQCRDRHRGLIEWLQATGKDR